MYSLHQTVKLMLIFTDMPSSCSLAASYSDVTAYVKPGTCTKFAKCAFCSLFFFVCSSSAVNIQYNIGSVDSGWCRQRSITHSDFFAFVN